MVPAATNVMCELVEVTVTGDGSTAAADVQHECHVAKSTIGAAGTSTTVTAEPSDDASNAARTITKVKYSAEGTTIGTVFPVNFGFNQRGGMRWAVPRGEGVFAYQPLTNKGLVVCVVSSAVGAVQGFGAFWEP
jgi:hypothetical protein